MQNSHEYVKLSNQEGRFKNIKSFYLKCHHRF